MEEKRHEVEGLPQKFIMVINDPPTVSNLLDFREEILRQSLHSTTRRSLSIFSDSTLLI